MSRVAVTGAGGFIARALEPLLAEGSRPAGLFRSASGRLEAWRAAGHEVVEGDLCDRDALARLVDGAEVVYHLAARRGSADPAESRRVNVEGTERLARAAAAAGVARLVYVSSIAVYSATDASGGTIAEEVEPARAKQLNPYAATKLAGERALRRLADGGEAPPFTVVRPTNVYGPWGRAWFLDWVGRLERLPWVIGGNVRVDLVHVDDVARGILLAGTSDRAESETFHLGHESVLLADFARRVGEAVGVRVLRLPGPLDRLAREGIDRGHRLLHGSRRSTPLTREVRFPHDKARRLLGYRPSVSLDEGFGTLARWYREFRGGEGVRD